MSTRISKRNINRQNNAKKVVKAVVSGAKKGVGLVKKGIKKAASVPGAMIKKANEKDKVRRDAMYERNRKMIEKNFGNPGNYLKTK